MDMIREMADKIVSNWEPDGINSKLWAGNFRFVSMVN